MWNLCRSLILEVNIATIMSIEFVVLRLVASSSSLNSYSISLVGVGEQCPVLYFLHKLHVSS